MPEITLEGEKITYSIRRSARARRMSLKIDPQQGLEVVLPKGMSKQHIVPALHSRANWILKHTRRMANAQPPDRRYVDGETLHYLGDPFQLMIDTHAEDTQREVMIRLHDDRFQIRLPKVVAAAWENDPLTRTASLRGLVGEWYGNQARAYIPPRVAEWGQRCGIDYATIRIKDQKTRWGSASTLRNLNFNRRLMMAPPDAVDYVIIHELCHLREMNHSPRFWELVGRYCPDYEYWVRWFKDQGHLLTL